MMEQLAQLLHSRDIPFDGKDRRIMCYGHIIDLSSKRVVDGLSRGAYSDDWDEPTRPTEPTTYNDAIARDVISHARTAVRVIRGSGMRRDAFDELIVNGNLKGWFKAGQPPKTVQLKNVQLLRDVQSRWDSEFLMLNRLRELRPVCLFTGEVWHSVNKNDIHYRQLIISLLFRIIASSQSISSLPRNGN
jgi:hypothetical protein